MDGIQLLKFELDLVGSQIERAIEGLDPAHHEARIQTGHYSSLSPRETLVHLTECYIALQESANGKEHEWGSYMPADPAWDAVLAEFRTQRAAACKTALDGNDDKAVQSGVLYITNHDAYHVGQLVPIRISVQPDWDSYSIYA